MSYDFSRLTRRQQELLSFGGWYVGRGIPPQPRPATVRKLIERGLLVPHERLMSDRFGNYSITEYEVPTPVHIAWCERCSRLYPLPESP